MKSNARTVLTRRDLLRHAALGTAAWGTAGLTLGCGSSGSLTPPPRPAPTRSTVVTPSTLASREAYYVSGDLYTFLASSEETGGLFNAFEFIAPPGGGPLPHIHGNEAEIFYVLDGSVTNDLDHNSVEATRSAFLYGAQGRNHGFRNNTAVAGRVLSITVPNGLAEYFRLVGRRVVDRNAAIPTESQQQLGAIIEVALHRGDRPFRPEDSPPEFPQLLDRVLVVPGSGIDPALQQIGGLDVFTRDLRPPATIPFGLTGTSLVTFEETNGTVSYTEIVLPTQAQLPAPAVSPDQHVLYVVDGTLAMVVGGQSIVAPANTFASIVPGDAFAIANLAADPTRFLFVTIRPGSNFR
jgi:mannose-6-phosphate isomerase-like protein (cupin superfamily)